MKLIDILSVDILKSSNEIELKKSKKSGKQKVDRLSSKLEKEESLKGNFVSKQVKV